MPTYDITDDVVSDIGTSYQPSVIASSASTPESLKWDCSVGGKLFLFAFSEQFPMRRETATFRRDRVDTERNPGEQSLDSGYWLRSQASWHYGSGISSAEPLEVSDAESQFRYERGGGVNPWSAGELTLLNDTEQKFASTGSNQQLIGVDTGVLHADGTTVTYVTTSSTSTVTWGGSTNPITSLASDGAKYYVANSTGIYSGTLPSSAGSLIWNTGNTSLVRWVKSRLMAAVGAALYELTGTGPTLPTALFTHPASGWTWTDFAEGPTSIYVSGYSGDTSIVYKIGVNSTTSTVTLNQPVVVAELPRGEIVKSLYSYIGTYLVIGTSKGVRIALINDDGSLTFGPRIVESSDGCLDAVADGSFVYVTMGTKGETGDRTKRAGLYRIDLGTVLNGNPLAFARAADLVCPAGIAGACHQVTTAGGKLWFTVTGAGGGVFRQTDTYVPEGWIETGRIRLGTVENKAWRTLRLLQKEGTSGSLAAYASVSSAPAPTAWTPIVSMPSGYFDVSGALNTVAPIALPSLYVAIKLSTSDTSKSPALTGWQVKAVPSPKRAELIQVPVMCYDTETDRSGARFGKPGNSYERFRSLKDLEASAATVQWNDYTTGESAEAFIEQVAFIRMTPPSRGFSGAGGVMTITLRLV